MTSTEYGRRKSEQRIEEEGHVPVVQTDSREFRRPVETRMSDEDEKEGEAKDEEAKDEEEESDFRWIWI